MTHPILQIGDEARPMTEDEYAAHLQAVADVEAQTAAQEAERAAQEAAKRSARAKLAALGLTNDEINALIP